ncbi:MAG: tetratricopeptide repeat protein [Nannocystaceae bacterium]
MTDSPPNFRPAKDEPAVLSPDLLAFVDAARNMPVPEVRVTADAIHRGAKTRRQQTALRIGLGTVAALAAAILVIITAGGPETPPPNPNGNVAERNAPRQAVTEKQVPVAAKTLAPGIEVTRSDGGELAIEVHSTHRLELGEGSYRIQVDQGLGQPLTVTVGEQTLELVHGVVHTQVSGQVFEAALELGEARWVYKGERTKLATKSGMQPPARQLVRRAEAAMNRGDQPAAIDTLERLQAAYPSHQATTTGMLDLARLYRISGQQAMARCTYMRLLDRPSAASFRNEIEVALAGLGPGAGCEVHKNSP